MQPLFVIDRDAIKARLRMSGTASGDAEALIDEAIQKVRVGFYNALGVSRVAAIAQITRGDPPVTAQQVLRAQAESAEVTWTRLHLLRMMPTLFVDGGGAGALAIWNQEGITRDAGQLSIEREVNRLQSEVNQALVDLEGAKSPDHGDASVSVIEPDTTPPRPFESIKAW